MLIDYPSETDDDFLSEMTRLSVVSEAMKLAGWPNDSLLLKWLNDSTSDVRDSSMQADSLSICSLT